jgi:succinate dehydrogenase / fumarate reductase cytochrome b subunit
MMAVTGLIMASFLIIHLIGNTTVWGGAGWLNAYAEHLHALPPLVWAFRIVMLAVFAFHIWLGIQLTLENSAARPIQYQQKKNLRTTFSAETMIYTGLLILAFVVYHILHFTMHVTNPEISVGVLPPDAMGRHDVFSMVVFSFQKIAIAFIYALAMIIIFLHLYHGISSLFQTMGWNNDKTISFIEKVGKGVAFVLLVGFIAIPVLIVLGLVKV